MTPPDILLRSAAEFPLLHAAVRLTDSPDGLLALAAAGGGAT